MTTARSLGPCVACGRSASIERNHVGAKANDPDLTFPFCRACHDRFTDWQWRLGILRRETPSQRRQHSELERAWALTQGFVLTTLLAGADAQAAVALGRASGNLLAMCLTAAGQPVPWGPTPARRRGSAEPFPEPRGAIDLAQLVRLMADVSERLGGPDSRLAASADGAAAIGQWAAALDATGPLAGSGQLMAITTRIVEILRTLGAVGGLDDLVSHGSEIVWLVRVAERMLELLPALAAAETLESATAVLDQFAASLS